MAAPSIPSDAERLYLGTVPVVLKHPDREDRSSTLTVVMTYVTGQPRNQKVLHVQLTDESDSYLLYTLNISEDDFHALKTEQSILVDFPTFPSKFIELLRHCQTASSDEHPKFVAVLSTLSGAPMLTITETNPFRQLAHLSLRFVAGNDAAIKKYLAGRLADFKGQLAITSDELGQRTMQLQETAELASEQSERLRTVEEDHVRALNELEVRHTASLADAKEAAVSSSQEQARLGEQERIRIVERCENELSTARQAQAASELELAKLKAAHHELGLQLRERTSRLTGSDQDVTLLRAESSTLREENSQLTALKHKYEKTLSARDVELAMAVQSMKDKEALLAKVQTLLEASQEAKKAQEEAVGLHKASNAKLTEKLSASSAEIAKGNTIIGKLQSDGRELKGKLRLKAAVMLQQQEHAQQKQAELEASERSAADLRTQVAEVGNQRERSDEALAACKTQLAEAQELLRSNQQVIQWLNKELNDAQTGGKPYVNIAPRVAAFRPSLPQFGKGAAGTTGAGPEAAMAAAMASVSPSKDEKAADAYVPGAALASLRSRAGLAMAEKAAGDTMNTGFENYLSPSATG